MLCSVLFDIIFEVQTSKPTFSSGQTVAYVYVYSMKRICLW